MSSAWPRFLLYGAYTIALHAASTGRTASAVPHPLQGKYKASPHQTHNTQPFHWQPWQDQSKSTILGLSAETQRHCNSNSTAFILSIHQPPL